MVTRSGSLFGQVMLVGIPRSFSGVGGIVQDRSGVGVNFRDPTLIFGSRRDRSGVGVTVRESA